MKKKLVALLLTAAMVGSFSMTTMAADGEAATAPVGTTPAEGTVVSSGSATVESADGNTFSTTGDDDALAVADDTTGTDINVWAKVIDKGTKIYKVDLGWGAMKFQYNSGSGKWNTGTHTYDQQQAGTASWTVDGYLDGTNNKVTVTNHSNSAVDATFAYAMDLTDNKSLFNDDPTAVKSVKGNFFEDNTKAVTAASVLNDTTTVADKLSGSKVTLPTADAYNNNTVAAGERTDDVFFAFSGTPDEGKGANLDSFKKVGVITVTVTPNTTADIN